ncbi:MAG: ArnT family glycosyltransferase, partial [Candidatus Zixiibacteriota bacterium]
MPDLKVHLILFAAALAFRSIFLLEISDMPTFSHPVMDEGYHLELANQILSGSSGVAETPYYRAPMYPYFFTALLWLGDGSLFFVRLVQILLGSLLPGLIFLIGRTLFERRVALLAAGAATVFPTFLYYDSSLLITGLIVFLSALVVWQTLRAGRAPTPRNFILLGALIGLAALARPNVLFYLPALGLWFWFCIRPLFHHRLKNTLTAYAIVIAAALAVIAPVTIRNWVVSGDFIFISWQGGYNFFLGNNHLASGWSATAPGIDATWMGGYRDAINLAEANVGRK